MLYIIGLGLNEKSLSLEALEVVKKIKKVYLEGYTVDFPYKVEALEKTLGKKIELLERKDIEGEAGSKLVDSAKKEDIAVLVYGSPLFATTHISLVLDAKERGVEVKILYNSSIYDAIASSGLQLYKFGKIASMAKWIAEQNYKPDSFVEIIKDNQKIKAHTLLLIDIGFKPADVFEQLSNVRIANKIKLEKIIVCSQLGTVNNKIFYSSIDNLKKQSEKIMLPFCVILPSVMHFLEKEALESIAEKKE